MNDGHGDISVETERTLMKTLHAVIRRNQDDFEALIASFPTREALLAADARCTNLCALIMLQQYSGAPDEESVLELAESTSAIAVWSGITAAQFSAYIYAIFTRQRIHEVLEMKPAVRVPFILLAYLLVVFHKEEEHWHNYLDRVWELLLDGPQLLKINCGH